RHRRPDPRQSDRDQRPAQNLQSRPHSLDLAARPPARQRGAPFPRAPSPSSFRPNRSDTVAYSSLREFLSDLEADRELIRVTEPVSTNLEITELHRRLIAAKGPAAILENVVNERGQAAEMPALINLFGTVERVARAVTLGGAPRRTAA